MPKSNKPIPEGFHAVTPQLVIEGAQQAIELYRSAFGAEVMHLMKGPDGRSVMHANLRLGDSFVFVSDVGFGKPTAANLFLYVPDVDAAISRAVKAGCKAVAPISDMFWGDRWGMVEDPFGNQWQLATHIEDVPPEEMARRMQAMGGPK